MAGLNTEQRTYETGVASARAVLPEAPERWSYSALKDVETCPRRYVLSRADYPDLWDRHGFPRLPVLAAIKGDIVHHSLEIIVRAIVHAGCPSTRSQEAVGVLRELGGYTAVAEHVLEKQLARFDGNPRIDADRRNQLARALDDWIPSAREQIQTYLGRMELTGIGAPRGTESTKASEGAEPSRHPADVGDHPEQVLVAEDHRLMGRLDLLRVTSEGASIIDFKTGDEDSSHYDQLRLYALLWHKDTTVNAEALPVTELIASYPSHEVAVPIPDPDELAQLATEIATRIAAADAAVLAEHPQALVGEQCGLCSVRALCDTYWGSGAPRISDAADGALADLEGTILREHGVKSWVVVESGSGEEVLVRTPRQSVTLPIGDGVRILGARRTVDPDEGDALIASLTSTSEVFLLVT